MEPTLPQTVATALINIGLAWVAGVLASRFWLMQRSAQWQDAAVRRLSVAMPAGLAACAAGMLLSLWTEAAAMGDVGWLDAWPAFVIMLSSTHYGHAGAAAAALLIVAMLAHWRLRRSGSEMRYVGIITVLVLLVGVARVAIGHAFEHGPFSAAVWVEWLHLLFMSLWSGTVFVAGWAVLPQVLATEAAATEERDAYLTAMSDWATVALAGVLATGAWNAYRVFGSPRDLLESDYGHVLVLKLCFVLAAIALGGLNRFYGLPAILASGGTVKARRGLRTVITILRIESIVLLLALLAAAVLVNSAPPV